MKYIQKQDELNSLLKNQMKEEEIGLFDARFSKLKEAMKIIKANYQNKQSDSSNCFF